MSGSLDVTAPRWEAHSSHERAKPRTDQGTIVTLTTDNGSSHDDVFNGTWWDDNADPGGTLPYVTNDGLTTDHSYQNGVAVPALVPEEPLGAFAGESPNGAWTLTISNADDEDGTLAGWSLEIATDQCSATCDVCEQWPARFLRARSSPANRSG
jgi:hypothetical protein